MSNRDPLDKNPLPRSQQGASGAAEEDDSFANKGTDFSRRVKDQAGSAVDKVSEGFDKGRKATADTLHRAASTLRDKAQDLPGGETTAGIVGRVAETVESTGAYLREHDIDDMKTDVERMVRRNPAQSLIAACVVGFLIGRAFRR